MMERGPTTNLKRLLGKIPLTAEVYQLLRPAPGELPGGFRLDRLESALPGWLESVSSARSTLHPSQRKRVLLLASLRWWIEYAVAVGLLLAGLGHEVELAYLPYRTWWEPVDPFDIRRHKVYLKSVLRPLKKLLHLHDISSSPEWQLNAELDRSIKEQSRLDVQYTLQRESINLEGEGEDQALFELRQKRNCCAANAALDLLPGDRFDSVIIPNGSILEFGVFYRVAKYLGVPAVTIEFGEQRERMWLAQDDEVMRLDTSALWEARKSLELTVEELDALKELYQARRGGQIWANFSRQWQAGDSKGAAHVRGQLNLDREKPIALLCTNVVGDSLALGRQVFTSGMADWLAKTVRHFAQRQDVQLIVRVHPGELLGAGHPSVDIVSSALPELPPHVILVPPESTVNTYDLIELANVGLVYTTTVGMEMAMSGVPVIVSGMTHYRGKGFTYDPETMAEYVAVVDQLIRGPREQRFPREQIDLAWRYAYRFFFEFPFSFPWHLVSFWEDIKARPFEAIFDGLLEKYRPTCSALLSLPVRKKRATF
jgi:hypothetical protein